VYTRALLIIVKVHSHRDQCHRRHTDDNACIDTQSSCVSRVLFQIFNFILLQLYAPLNIFVALVGIVVWSEKDEIQISVKGDETLTNFLHYRRVRLSKEHPNDNAQLLTYVYH
jgi:hypothetical protein